MTYFLIKPVIAFIHALPLNIDKWSKSTFLVHRLLDLFPMVDIYLTKSRGSLVK